MSNFVINPSQVSTPVTSYDTYCYTNDNDDIDSDQIANRTGSNRLWGGLAIIAGGALIDKYATKIRFKLKVNGACTGNLVGQIRKDVTTSGRGSNVLTSSNSIDLSTIQDTEDFRELEFDGSYKFGTNSNEAILIYWSVAESNGSATIWLALRWLQNHTANTADVVSTTNDGAPSQVDFEFWYNQNTNMNITYTS